jgi:hypothetical protein
LFLWCEVLSLTPNPQPGGPGYPSSSSSYLLTCSAWVTLPVATLLPAWLSGSREHSNPTTTIRWRHHQWGDSHHRLYDKCIILSNYTKLYKSWEFTNVCTICTSPFSVVPKETDFNLQNCVKYINCKFSFKCFCTLPNLSHKFTLN